MVTMLTGYVCLNILHLRHLQAKVRVLAEARIVGALPGGRLPRLLFDVLAEARIVGALPGGRLPGPYLPCYFRLFLLNLMYCF